MNSSEGLPCSDLHSGELLSETLKALTSLSNKTAKAKRGVTFPIIMLQQAIADGDREEITRQERAGSQGSHWNSIVTQFRSVK